MSLKSVSNKRKIQIIVGVFGLITIGLIVSTTYLGIQLRKKNNEESSNDEAPPKTSEICLTRECVTAAGQMIRNTQSSWNQFNILREQLSRNIREILEREANVKDPMPLGVAKTFYKNCIEQNTTDSQPLTSYIEVLMSELSLADEIGDKLGVLRRLASTNLIITTTVGLDEVNTTVNKIYVDQPSLGLNRVYLVPTVEVPVHNFKLAYIDLLKELWPEIYPEDLDKVDQIAQEIVNFETKIAEISTEPAKRRDRKKLYNPMSISELAEHTQTATMLDWRLYFEQVFMRLPDGDVDLDNVIVIVRDLDYFSKLGEILTQASEEQDDILNQYLKWRLVLTYASDANSKLRDILFTFSKKTQGTLYPAPRWQVCSDRANAYFGMAISFDYVQDVFSPDFKEKMSELIENTRDAFYQILDEIEWFGEPNTAISAKEKARKMLAFIGYPEWLLDDTNDYEALKSEYIRIPEDLTEYYFENAITVAKWKSIEGLNRINGLKDSTKWVSDPTVVNAFYSSTYNSITFPGGILQAPFYFTGKPIQALNYGAIGAVIGHEITHGFDDRGRQSDGDGNLQDWWDEGTVAQYTEKAKCFVDQYSSYTAEEADDLPLNGNNTLGENIADNGGVRQAFRAYQTFIKKNGEEPRLPGLEYAPEQLFFLAYAQIWCGAYTKEGMENQINTGVHSPNRFRVKGVLQNSFEFADAWKCPRPDESLACRIW